MLKKIFLILSLCSACIASYGEARYYGSVDLEVLKLDTPAFRYINYLSPPFGRFIDQVDDPIGFYPKLAVGVEWDNDCCGIGQYLNLEAYGFWFSEKETSKIEGLQSLAIPFIDLGLRLSITGEADIGFARNYDYYGGGILFKTHYGLPISNCDVFLTPYIDFSVNKFNQHYSLDGSLFVPIPFLFTFKLNEKIDNTYYDLGLGLNAEVPFWNCFSFNVGGGAYASLSRTELSAFESTPTFSVFDEIHDEKSHLSSKFKGNVGLSYHVTRNIVISLEGNVEYWGYVPQIVNPNVVDIFFGSIITDGPARLGNTSAFNYAYGAKVLCHF